MVRKQPQGLRKVPDAFFSDAIIDYAYSHYRNMLPLHRWLKKVLD